jgi:hypothetical protein
MIFQKAVPRRAFLRGLGSTLALPLLEAMTPAFAAPARPLRLGIYATPNGMMMDKWTPTGEGADFQLSPILEPLAAHRKRMVVISGLAQNEARKFPGEGGGEHPRACTAFLTGVHARMTSGADLRAGTSVDQLAARELGQQTQLASLEIGLESADILGSCESSYSCAYYNTLSWANPTTPLPMEHRPRAVFERLFGDSDSTDPEERLARIRENRSILDHVSQDVTKLLRDTSAGDKAKLDQYLEAVRDVERRIQLAEKQSKMELPRLDRPVGIPDNFPDYCRLMFDLQVIAYQTDLTRVCTFMVGHEMSNRAYPELNIGDAHHPLTHHQGDQEKIAKVIRVNIHHAKQFAYLADRLASIPDGDGTLLDHTLLMYSSPLSDGNMHVTKNLPIAIVGGPEGGGIGPFRGGRHLRYPMDTPMTNLYLTMLATLGVNVNALGDSTGKLDLLAV